MKIETINNKNYIELDVLMLSTDKAYSDSDGENYYKETFE